MGGAVRSAGFGRIGGEVRPSLYTPVHLPTSPWPDGRPPASATRRPAVRADVAIGVAIAAAVLLAVAVGAVVTKQRPVDVVPVDTASDEAPVLDAEADRLNRSAFGTQRLRS